MTLLPKSSTRNLRGNGLHAETIFAAENKGNTVQWYKKSTPLCGVALIFRIRFHFIFVRALPKPEEDSAFSRQGLHMEKTEQAVFDKINENHKAHADSKQNRNLLPCQRRHQTAQYAKQGKRHNRQKADSKKLSARYG